MAWPTGKEAFGKAVAVVLSRSKSKSLGESLGEGGGFLAESWPAGVWEKEPLKQKCSEQHSNPLPAWVNYRMDQAVQSTAS